jgi:trk system potassium uptake protein TrkA
VFIAVTQGDNTNIMAAQIAKEVFETPKVMARIYDPIRSHAYRGLGIMTLCSTTVAAGIFLAAAVDTPESETLQSQVESWEEYYIEKVW